MKVSTLAFWIVAVAVGSSSPVHICSGEQPTSSLSDLDIEYGELRVAFEKVLEENQQLRSSLSANEKTLLEMRTNLAAASGETEIFKRQAVELKLRIEALGLETAFGTDAKIEQRLLAAVRDLRVAANERRKVSEALIRLADAVGAYTKEATGVSPETRLSLEVELRNANAAIAGSAHPPRGESELNATVMDGVVISTKDDLGLIVMNLGSKQGVKVGMPFKVQRSGETVGAVRVVDVREDISGAVVQNLKSEKDQIKISDHLKVDTAQ